MFVKLTEGSPSHFPYTTGDLCRDHPGTSFPENLTNDLLADFDVYPVKQVAAPAFNSDTHKVRQWVELVDQEWTHVWSLVQLPEQRAAENVRADRNRRLINCDWTQLPDAPVDAAAWATYRQGLRDISNQTGFPWDVQWPEEPA